MSIKEGFDLPPWWLDVPFSSSLTSALPMILRGREVFPPFSRWKVSPSLFVPLDLLQRNAHMPLLPFLRLPFPCRREGPFLFIANGIDSLSATAPAMSHRILLRLNPERRPRKAHPYSVSAVRAPPFNQLVRQNPFSSCRVPFLYKLFNGVSLSLTPGPLSPKERESF